MRRNGRSPGVRLLLGLESFSSWVGRPRLAGQTALLVTAGHRQEFPRSGPLSHKPKQRLMGVMQAQAARLRVPR